MMLRLVILLSVAPVTFAKNCGFPNATNYEMWLFSCVGCKHLMFPTRTRMSNINGLIYKIVAMKFGANSKDKLTIYRTSIFSFVSFI